MIMGIGVDLVEIDRIGRVLSRHREGFVNRLLTPPELEHWLAGGARVESLAGRWAAKEAVSKALGSGFLGFGLHDVAIIHDAWGKPQVALFSGALEQARRQSIQRVLVTISHSAGHAVALAVAE